MSRPARTNTGLSKLSARGTEMRTNTSIKDNFKKNDSGNMKRP